MCVIAQLKRLRRKEGMKPDGTLGGERFPCPHRDVSVEENLEKFRQMRDGKYNPGEATLRMEARHLLSFATNVGLGGIGVLNAPHPSDWR